MLGHLSTFLTVGPLFTVPFIGTHLPVFFRSYVFMSSIHSILVSMFIFPAVANSTVDDNIGPPPAR